MRQVLLFGLLCLLTICGCSEEEDQRSSIQFTIVSDDITNFWQAYDRIISEQDSAQQRAIVKQDFIEKASPGQLRMMQERNYSADDYLQTMNLNQGFWNSIRSTTENLEHFNAEIHEGLASFKQAYPQLSSAKVYYTMGAHRSPGTGVDSLVLIGTEFALGKQTTETASLPDHLQQYYKINPVDHFKFLVVHEYVHTQQKPMVHNLLSLALYEGIADFVANKVTQETSPFDAFEFGAKNGERIRERFEEDMFRPNVIFNWLWNSPKNEFGTRDLGYFVGFSIASAYYNQSNDQKRALAELIELDYQNEEEVGRIVDTSGYFSAPLDSLLIKYEQARPRVTKVGGVENLSTAVSPGRKTITMQFSEAMNPEGRGFDFGPLGEEHVMKVDNVIGFSPDSTAFSFEVVLKENMHYQTLVTNRFMSANGIPLKPFLFDLQTIEK